MLHPDYPVVEGLYWLTADWMVTLPFKMNRRLEDDSLVLWRPGFTIWISIWGNDGKTCRESYESVLEDANLGRFDENLIEQPEAIWFSYRLKEHLPVPALYAFAFAPGGYIQAALYFDVESDLEHAKQISMSFSAPLG